MTFIQSIILGFIQGITEFLPISSSAHLVLTPYFFNWNIPPEQVFPFDVLVQLGTILAVIVYFWNDLWAILSGWVTALLNKKPFETQNARMGWYVILASVPAGLLGVLVKDQVEAVFHSEISTAIFLFLTAVFLCVAEWLGKRTRDMEKITWLDALIIGIFQGISLLPGVSRSGATITGGMLRNLNRSDAARFSFIMSVPVMLGAGLVSIPDLVEVPNLAGFLPVILTGFVVAAIVGYLAIRWLLSFLRSRSLFWFAGYCVLLGTVTLVVAFIR